MTENTGTAPGIRPVEIVAIGAGNRARKYLHYILHHPHQTRLAGVVDPDELRRHKFAEAASLPPERCFSDCDAFFNSGVKADAVMICTPDGLHFTQCMQALRHGCHVLLEKPVACSLQECETIEAESARRGLIVSVGHVLRYHPYFAKIKEIASSGRLGKIVSVSHRAQVGTDRATHSYVRGIWNRDDTGNPMILSKCCHDVDFLVWITEAPCRSLASYGSLRGFRPEMAPQGAADRCVACAVERNCPFSAVRLYRDRREWIANFDVPPGGDIADVIEEQLHHGPYGRCVYHCDNNVVDHQVLAMEMDNGITSTLSMDSFTMHDNRETHICLTHGEIIGDERTIEERNFLDRSITVHDFSKTFSEPFHAGADLRLVEDFVTSIITQDHLPLTSIDTAIASHRICFQAETSRRCH